MGSGHIWVWPMMGDGQGSFPLRPFLTNRGRDVHDLPKLGPLSNPFPSKAHVCLISELSELGAEDIAGTTGDGLHIRLHHPALALTQEGEPCIPGRQFKRGLVDVADGDDEDVDALGFEELRGPARVGRPRAVPSAAPL